MDKRRRAAILCGSGAAICGGCSALIHPVSNLTSAVLGFLIGLFATLAVAFTIKWSRSV